MDLKNIQTKKMKYNHNNSIISLENIPNELWLQVLSYLNIVDIYHIFYGLNQRFNELIDESVRHVSLPSNVSDTWLNQHTPQISDKIKTICLYSQRLEKVFNNQWSFPNLRLINLQGNKWNLSLIIKEKPLPVILMSVIQFLQSIRLYINPNSRNMPSFTIDDADDYLKTLSCPYIERLSVIECPVEILSIICSRLPNLTYLKIYKPLSHWYSGDQLDTSEQIKVTTRLVTLSITTHPHTSFGLLEQLIQSCKTSLQNLQLNVCSNRSIDGNRLEELFKSCEKLKNLVFSFDITNDKIKIDDCLRSFQSKWWLDTRRPAVYIQQASDFKTIIVTMPCKLQFSFKNNLSYQCFNKGDKDSSFVRFNNINEIHFTNNAYHPISLDYLYSIARIFTSSNQTLQFNYWGLEDANYSFEMFIDDTPPQMKPILLNVNYFIIKSSNNLEDKALSFWILMAPNLRKLNISNLTTHNKTNLAKELSVLVNEHDSLKSRFNEINELIILSPNSYVDTKTKNELIIDFQKIFINAVIS